MPVGDKDVQTHVVCPVCGRPAETAIHSDGSEFPMCPQHGEIKDEVPVSEVKNV